MKVVVQRTTHSSVTIDNKLIDEIDKGLCILVGFTEGDSETEIDYIINKITKLRIFDDENGVMNKSILDINGEILSISQFTLYANPYEGNRPSYLKALKGEESSKLYDLFNSKLNMIVNTKTGVFEADMKVNILNDGPVTIIIDSNKIM